MTERVITDVFDRTVARAGAPAGLPWEAFLMSGLLGWGLALAMRDDALVAEQRRRFESHVVVD